MLDYIEGEEYPEYTHDDVTQCITLLLEFMTKMDSESHTIESVTFEIKDLILSLNSLNASTSDTLIESFQAKQICKFINQVNLAADIKFEGDITAQWRHW